MTYFRETVTRRTRTMHANLIRDEQNKIIIVIDERSASPTELSAMREHLPGFGFEHVQAAGEFRLQKPEPTR